MLEEDKPQTFFFPTAHQTWIDSEVTSGSSLPGESTGMVGTQKEFLEGLMVPITSSQQIAAVNKKGFHVLHDYLQNLKEHHKLSISGVEVDSSSEEKSLESSGN